MEIAKPILDSIFSQEINFIVPAYQRHYVWDEKEQWQPLWEDILNKYNDRMANKETYNHYIGSYVLVQKKKQTSLMVNKSIVIDGQQRLTTFQIILIALREIFRKYNIDTNVENFIFNNRNYEDKKDKLKLAPSNMNYDSFYDIANMTRKEFDEKFIKPQLKEIGVQTYTATERLKKKDRILKAYLFFYNKINELAEKYFKQNDIDRVGNCLNQLLNAITLNFQFVEINLDENDDPQMVFETLNGRGTPLAESDLIRNYIFMRANKNKENMDVLYASYWNIFEQGIWDDFDSRGRNKNKNLDLFFIDYLTIKTAKLIPNKKIFFEYKDWIANNKIFLNIEEELKDISKTAKIYEKLNIEKEVDNDMLQELLKVNNNLNISTLNPLILFIESSGIDEELKDKFYALLLSYVVRRYICGKDSKNYNKTCIEFIENISSNKYNYDLFENFIKSRKADTYIFPNDDMFLNAILSSDVFTYAGVQKLTNYVLENIEYKIRTNKQENIKIVSKLTLEHIMPQSWCQYWALNEKKYSADDVKKSRSTSSWSRTEEDTEIVNRCALINTFGNLTLLTQSLNSDKEVSNKGFDVKGPKIVEQSSLELNKYFKRPKWDENEIKKRGNCLFEYAKDIWKY